MFARVKLPFNLRRIKLFFVGITLGLILYKIYLWFSGIETSCKGLFLNGTSDGTNLSYWRTSGCINHQYSYREVDSCFNGLSKERNGKVHLVLIGDSRMRNFLEYHKSTYDNIYIDPYRKIRYDMVWESKNITVKISFYWQPFLNSSTIELLKNLTDNEDNPDLILMSMNLWHIKYKPEGEKTKENYERIFNQDLVPVVQSFLDKKKTKFIWMIQPKILLPYESEHYRNEFVSDYNEIASTAFRFMKSSEFYLWSSVRQVVEEAENPLPIDGLHFGMPELRTGNNMLYNLLCNNQIDVEPHSCCKTNKIVTRNQFIICVIFITCYLLLLLFKMFQQFYWTIGNRFYIATKTKRAEKSFFYISKLGLIIFYIHLCQNTNLFEVEERFDINNISNGVFGFLMGVTMLIGFGFNEESKSAEFLNRQQTNEWKGMILCFVLVYFYSWNSKLNQESFLEHIFVSSYLFVNGFGHSTFFLGKEIETRQKCWSGLMRFTKIIFRMNFFYSLISTVVDETFDKFNFALRMTFWFVLQCIISYWPCQVFKSQLSKRICMTVSTLSIIVISNLILKSEDLSNKVFLILEYFDIHNESGNSNTWQRRLELDTFSSCMGVTFGIVLSGELNFEKFKVSKLTQIFTLSFVLLGAGLFYSWIPLENNNPKIAILVVLVIIPFARNVFPQVRRRHSRIFAWLGHHSLEIYLTQFHIWMAGKDQGRLILIPNHQLLNLFWTTSIFFLVSQEVHSITRKLCRKTSAVIEKR